MAAATLHRLHEPASKFSAEERAEILAKARQHVAEAKAEDLRRPSTEARIDSNTALESKPDPVRQWQLDAERRDAEMQAERRKLADVEQRRYRRQQRDNSGRSELWADYIAKEIATTIVAECEHTERLLIGLVSELTHELRALRTKCTKLEEEISAWRKC